MKPWVHLKSKPHLWNPQLKPLLLITGFPEPASLKTWVCILHCTIINFTRVYSPPVRLFQLVLSFDTYEYAFSFNWLKNSSNFGTFIVCSNAWFKTFSRLFFLIFNLELAARSETFYFSTLSLKLELKLFIFLLQVSNSRRNFLFFNYELVTPSETKLVKPNWWLKTRIFIKMISY